MNTWVFHFLFHFCCCCSIWFWLVRKSTGFVCLFWLTFRPKMRWDCLQFMFNVDGWWTKSNITEHILENHYHVSPRKTRRSMPKDRICSDVKFVFIGNLTLLLTHQADLIGTHPITGHRPSFVVVNCVHSKRTEIFMK